MGEANHYSVRSADPDENSFLAFLVAGEEILDRDPQVELWMAPVANSPDYSLHEARWADRANPVLNIIDECYCTIAYTRISEAGAVGRFPREAAASVVEAMLPGLRASVELAELRRPPVPERAEYFDRNARLINAVVDHLCTGRSRNARHEAAVPLLNKGIIQNASSRKPLDRFHVRRAVQRYQADLLRHINQRVLRSPVDLTTFLQAELIGQRMTVIGLYEVYRAARRVKKFPWLSGRELALAIHAKHDLPHVMHQTLGILQQRQSAAA